MDKPVLLKEAKRCFIYGYGKDGEITVSKRLAQEEELDYVELLDSGNIEIKNSTECKGPIDLCGHMVDPEALKALDLILDQMF